MTLKAGARFSGLTPVAKKLTLKDLARAAKVSTATASRVIAGNSTVDPEMRARVRKAAARLGLNLHERRNSRSRILAFLLANRDVLHTFQARVLLGAEKYCTERKWELIFMGFAYPAADPVETLHLPHLLSGRTNARAAILGGTNSDNLLQALRAREIPFAVLGNNVVGEWKPELFDVVYSDDVSGAKDAALHLISRGHREIAFIGNLGFPWFARCASGYRAAMTEAGLTPDCVDLRFDGTELGYLATKQVLARSRRPTAILAGSDQVAHGVYQALREAAVSIPEEMSVVGFNDTQGELFYPLLTSVREFPEKIGHLLAEFVLDRLENPELPPRQATIPTRLIARESVRSLS